LKQRLTYRRGNAAQDVGPGLQDQLVVEVTAHARAAAAERIAIEVTEDPEAQSAAECLQAEEPHTGRSRRELKLESKCCRASESLRNKTVGQYCMAKLPRPCAHLQISRVYVGNLSYDVKWHHLKDFMRSG
jgi:hypothetical protein